MKTKWIVMARMMFGIAVAFCPEPSAGEPGNLKDNTPSGSDSQVVKNGRVPLVVARDRAKVMHDIYEAALDVMHHRYFHRERAVGIGDALTALFSSDD